MKNSERTEATRERILSLIGSEFESDAAFERELGLPSKTVNNWRRGRSSSFMKMLPRLSESFDVNVGELLDIPIHKDTSELSEDEIALLSLYRKSAVLSAKQRIALAKTLESVINMYVNSLADGGKKSRAKGDGK
jgi:transcriptional regulator with XRE-family HTH domain